MTMPLTPESYLTTVAALYERFVGLPIDECPDFSSRSAEERLQHAKTLIDAGVPPFELVNDHANDCGLDRIDEEGQWRGGDWTDLDHQDMEILMEELKNHSERTKIP